MTSHSWFYVALMLIFGTLGGLSQGTIDPKAYFLLNGSSNTTMTKECYRVINTLPTDGTMPKWALQMLDSTGKLQSGITYGNTMSLGDYDQCIQIHDRGLGLQGKYCLVGYKFKEDVPLMYGVCIPNVCNIGSLIPSKQNKFYSRDDLCQTNEVIWDFGDTFCFLLIMSSMVLMICATFYDLHKRKHPTEENNRILMAFSIYSNTIKLCKLRANKLSCLHGIRVISMLWIMYGHRASIVIGIPSTNTLEILERKKNNNTNHIYAANVAVDTFFYITGFLISYNLLKRGKSFKLRHVPGFILHRWMRIFPTVFMMFLIIITISRRVGSGPFYQLGTEVARLPCVNHWFAYLFFFQNYINYDFPCLTQTWYLSVDMQLYVLSPLLMIPLCKLYGARKTKSIHMIFLILLTLSVFIPMIIALNNGNVNGFATHWRVSIYLIGIYAGMKAINADIFMIKINVIISGCIWIFVIITMVIIAFPARHVALEPNTIFSILWVTFGRPLWGLCLTWVIFSCMTGGNDLINNFLSSTIFEITSRLCFCMYALHNLEIGYQAISLRSSIYLNESYFIETWLSDIFITLFFSYFWSMLYEVPIIHLDKLIFENDKMAKTDDTILEVKKYQTFHKV